MAEPATNEMSGATAALVSARYGAEHLSELGPRTWSGTRFSVGWRMLPDGADLDGRLGVVALVVLDDGRIFEDSASTPPGWLAERYEAMLAREASQGGA